MARYFTENIGGRVFEVVAQDDTGLYSGAVCKFDGNDSEVRMTRHRGPEMLWIKLPEWPQPREVSTASVE
jgi:hypothetical protein